MKPTSNPSSSSGIFVYVQRGNAAPNTEDGVLRFPKEQLNIGKATDISLSGNSTEFIASPFR